MDKKNILSCAIFAKNMQGNGKNYTLYLTTLKRKDGTPLSCRVRFKAGNAPAPTECPMNILVNRTTANLATTHRTDKETGEVYEVRTLWVNEWEVGEPYVDHSLDDIV